MKENKERQTSAQTVQRAFAHLSTGEYEACRVPGTKVKRHPRRRSQSYKKKNRIRTLEMQGGEREKAEVSTNGKKKV